MHYDAPAKRTRPSACGERCQSLASCRQLSFAFRRVFPPRLLRSAFHVPNSGYKHVEQARIVPLSSEAPQVIVHRTQFDESMIRAKIP
jgi:hypothetical protein